jgi:hypothetical protein
MGRLDNKVAVVTDGFHTDVSNEENVKSELVIDGGYTAR